MKRPPRQDSRNNTLRLLCLLEITLCVVNYISIKLGGIIPKLGVCVPGGQLYLFAACLCVCTTACVSVFMTVSVLERASMCMCLCLNKRLYGHV